MSDEKKSSLGHLPAGERWAFDDGVTAVFDDMFSRSIPQYDVMRRSVHDVASSFFVKKTEVIDIGASRGESAARLIDEHGAQGRYLLVETSKPMLDVLRARFKGLIECSVVQVLDLDLRSGFPAADGASVVQSVLTLQFTPIEHRLRILRDCWRALRPGGAMILVEKILGDSADIDALLVKRHLQMKSEGGYSQEEIDRKRLSLEGVLVPVTARWNEEMLRSSGFREVDVFWRWMNFCAWVAIK